MKTVKVSDEDHRFIKILSAETGKRVERVVAEGVEMLRKKHAKRKPAGP